MRKRMLLGFAIAMGWTTAAAPAGRMDVRPLLPPEGYHLEVTFTSAVPDDYYVLSGPAESYAKFRVNDELRGALGRYAGRTAGSDRDEVVHVFVHLESVTTDYHQLGVRLLRPPGPRVAGVAGIVEARFDGWDWDRRGSSIPERVTKSVVLRLDSRLDRPGRQPVIRFLHASAEEVIDRDHWSPWAYTYKEVIQTSIYNAVVEVDRLLRESLK